MKTSTCPIILGLMLSCCSLSPLPAATAQERTRGWPAEVEQALNRAGTNRPELLKALETSPAEQQSGMAFLLANMPNQDLKSLRADFLRENVALAYQARKQVPWGKKIPEDIFLNDVLPYANVDEARHPWRKQMLDLCLPLVKDCSTPAEAAHRLNAALFPKIKVRYSTQRKKPNQSPQESIEQGLASCTGLSILLVDACRSVAVPARLAGTPLWANKRGNHTWVEIWDGNWHFAGAAEPDPHGLDHAWFVNDASQAKPGSPLHGIFAASYHKTGLPFPLVWDRHRQDVPAVEVTARYVKAPTPAPKPAPLSPAQVLQIESAARAFFTASEKERAQWKFEAALDQALSTQEEAVRKLVWKAYQVAPIHENQKQDFPKNEVRYDRYLSPYTVKTVGTRPANGWPLFIALHGGGGAPKAVNDSQWRVMQRYYKDQTSVTGYKYLALRAPNDTWNGFYDNYVPPLIVNLIRQFLLFGDVDGNKVFLLGYSHGGYGAFFVGPKIPDRFAAVHSSAAAPTDGTISPFTLRNTRFTFMIGERDNAYGRRQRCEAFNQALQKLKGASKDIFPVEMELKMGYGHGGLPDRDKIKDMYPNTRNPVPGHLTWELTDSVVKDFFWLSVPEPGKGQTLEALFQDNKVKITTSKAARFDLNLDSRLAILGKPLSINLDGKSQVVKLEPRFLTLCQSFLKRGDPELAFSCRISLTTERK